MSTEMIVKLLEQGISLVKIIYQIAQDNPDAWQEVQKNYNDALVEFTQAAIAAGKLDANDIS